MASPPSSAAIFFLPSLLVLLYQEEFSPLARDRLWFFCFLVFPFVWFRHGTKFIAGCTLIWLLIYFGKGFLEINLALLLTGNDKTRIVRLLQQSHRRKAASILQGTKAAIERAHALRDLSLNSEISLSEATLYLQEGIDNLEDSVEEHQMEKAELYNELAARIKSVDPAQACVYFESALALGIVNRSKVDPLVTIWMTNLAIFKQELGRLKESDELFVQVVEVKRMLNLPELLADWLISLAYLLLSRPAALPSSSSLNILALVTEALEIRISVFGKESLPVASALNDLALLTMLVDESKIVSAMELGKESANLYALLLGEDDAQTRKARSDWGL